jgi:CheY-like chemotaxis protein
MDNYKVLIVDDDPDIISALTAIIENSGFSVIFAYNKKEGMEKLIAEKPDIAVLDVMMETDQAGFEMSREIKSMPDFKNLPIIMLTGVGQVTGVNFQAAMSDKDWLPADSYIEKPVEPDELIEEIKNLMEIA